jgi:hypothetical protein
MMGLALVTVQTVMRQIQPSDQVEKSFCALAAAESGLADTVVRLDQELLSEFTSDDENLALSVWVPIQGGGEDAEYTYGLDTSKAGAVGEVRAYVAGRCGDQTRVLEAVLSKRSTLDYVYMSDIETPAFDLPGAYSTSLYSTSNLSSAQIAERLCTRWWYAPGQVKFNSSGWTSVTGNQRNQKLCQWAGIYNTERLKGAVHTNDVWRLQNTDLTAVIEEGGITSSCPATAAEGLAANGVGCPESSRFIDTGVSGGLSTFDNTYQNDTYRPTNYNYSALLQTLHRNPEYDSVLALPPSPQALAKQASLTGCVYTGPTRLRFETVNGVGYMWVTSPDTQVTRPGCDGELVVGEPTNGTRLKATSATAQPTKRVRLDQFDDLVIYVQDVPRSTGADDPDNAFDVNNRWAAGAEYSCLNKSVNSTNYPFVIPSDTVDPTLFSNKTGWKFKGFPSEWASASSPWYGLSCSSGDVYVQGAYKGAMTIASQSNIIVTSSLVDSALKNPTAAVGTAEYGQPDPNSASTLGLVAGKFAYFYRPTDAGGTWVGDWKTANAQDPKLNFAVLAISKCWGAQDHAKSINNGGLYLWGSLAQKYRCPVGVSGGSGYSKKYSYDERLADQTPPYMLELSDQPWGHPREGEIEPFTQAVGESVAYSLLRPTDAAGTTLNASSVALASAPNRSICPAPWPLTPADPPTPPNNCGLNGTTLTFAPPQEGLFVFAYSVATPLGKEVRRLVVVGVQP